jgi:hypothetical protein
VKKEKRKKKENKEKEKNKNRKVQFRHFTTSIQPVKPFCQTFSKTASAPSEKPLHQRSQSRSRFWRSRSPAKEALLLLGSHQESRLVSEIQGQASTPLLRHEENWLSSKLSVPREIYDD